MVAALRAGKERQYRGVNSSGLLDLVAVCVLKARNLLAGEEGNLFFGKVVFYNDFYLVENIYAKFALGMKKRYSFLGVIG